MKFIYLTNSSNRNGATGGAVYIPIDRVISIAPVYGRTLKEPTRYNVAFDAGGGEVEYGGCDDASDLIEAMERLPVPPGMTVQGKPVLWLDLEPLDMGGGVVAAVYDEAAGGINLVRIPVDDNIQDLAVPDPAAEDAVAAAERAAGGVPAAKAG